jgi:hypothetical protein
MDLNEREIQQQLTASEREVLVEDQKRWKRMGSGAHLDDWLAFSSGLMIRRRLAMRIAFVNRPEGRGYNEAFAALLKRDGLDSLNKTSITAVLWLQDPEHMTILREIRDAMPTGERARLNSPISARQRVEKVLKARAGGTEDRERVSPVALLRQQIADRDRALAELKIKLDHARGGSLFDLERDSPDAIARVVIDNVSSTKCYKIRDSLSKAIKAREQQRPLRPAG